jgi:hypothetical protein
MSVLNHKTAKAASQGPIFDIESQNLGGGGTIVCFQKPLPDWSTHPSDAEFQFR